MKILVLNSGSSSVKFQIIETDLERMTAHQDLTLAVGLVEKIGLSDSRLLLEVPDRKPYQDYREVLEHRTAIDWVLRILVDSEHGILESVEEIGAVGHRVVQRPSPLQRIGLTMAFFPLGVSANSMAP